MIFSHWLWFEQGAWRRPAAPGGRDRPRQRQQLRARADRLGRLHARPYRRPRRRPAAQGRAPSSGPRGSGRGGGRDGPPPPTTRSHGWTLPGADDGQRRRRRRRRGRRRRGAAYDAEGFSGSLTLVGQKPELPTTAPRCPSKCWPAPGTPSAPA